MTHRSDETTDHQPKVASTVNQTQLFCRMLARTMSRSLAGDCARIQAWFGGGTALNSRTLATAAYTASRAAGVLRLQPSSANGSIREIATSIPVGASPQILLTATGVHKSGAISALSDIIFSHGASIASTRKIVLEDHFAMMFSVWVPDDDKALSSSELAKVVAETNFDFQVQVKHLEAASPVPDADVQVATQRRMKLLCPQRPGIVLAVTEILKDHGCALSAIEADTVSRKGEIWFELECVVDLPSEDESGRIEEDLRYWTKNSDERTQLVFDKWVRPNHQPLSHA
jgi:predicted amino acid-binding ACT domain protein